MGDAGSEGANLRLKAQRRRGRGTIRASFCKNSGRTQLCELHPGKRDFAPRDFGQYGRHIGPRDRRSVTGDPDLVPPTCGPSGFFKPAFVLPVRGDWLVVEVVPPNRSLQVKLPANRENNRGFCKKNASNRLVLWPQVQENQWVNAKLPYAYEQGVYFTEQGGVFWLEGTYLDFRRLARSLPEE